MRFRRQGPLQSSTGTKGLHANMHGRSKFAFDLAPKTLDTKKKELIALGIGIAIRCDDCIGFHVKTALEQGVTREEISDTLAMATYMGVGPSVMYRGVAAVRCRKDTHAGLSARASVCVMLMACSKPDAKPSTCAIVDETFTPERYLVSQRWNGHYKLGKHIRL